MHIVIIFHKSVNPIMRKRGSHQLEVSIRKRQNKQMKPKESQGHQNVQEVHLARFCHKSLPFGDMGGKPW